MLDQYRGAESILVTDDEPTVLSLAKVVLRNYGYQVLLARNGQEALELHAQSGPVDLLLTDVVMPVMSGPQLVHEIKSHTGEVRCLFMSGYDHDQIRKHGVPDPGCDFLHKPFTPEALVRKVRQTLDAKREAE